MKLNTEIVDEKQNALIVSKREFDFIGLLKSELKKYSINYFFSPSVPKTLKVFQYVFIINEQPHIERAKNNRHCLFVHIYYKNKKRTAEFSSVPANIKLITINGSLLEKNEIDKILWFAFSKSKEFHLNLNVSQLIKRKVTFLPDLKDSYKRFITRKNIILFSLLSLVVIHLLFIPFLFISLLLNYQNFLSLKQNALDKIDDSTSLSRTISQTTRKLYSLVRPTYLLFGVAILPDNLIDINEKGFMLIGQTESLLKNLNGLESLVFLTDKTPEQKIDLSLRLGKIKADLNSMQDELNTIAQEIPTFTTSLNRFKTQMVELSDNFQKGNKVVDYFEKSILDKNPKKYVVFFANNTEIRPGGGFLGSFGIFEIGNYSVSDIKIYDIYDADGQLTVHLDPPKPIADYLSVPHWFFRDSNFSPDFFTNYQKALFFLDKEMKMTGFSGGILVTTSAVENILNAFGDIYIPDFNEYINSKNFYIKTQLYTEKKFFPGSIQKKTFLSSLVRQIQNTIDTANIKVLFSQIKKSLDEKQIVVYFDDQNFQSLFDSSFWSGRVIDPKCTLSQDCVTDYIFPYDANVGANKANFFVTRFMNLKINVDAQGKITHTLSLQYKNESPSLIFPTGYYRDYFQVLLPQNAILDQVTKDGVSVDKIDQSDGQYKLIGFLVELAPGKTVDLKISYQLGDTLKKGKNIYQLIVQKQIGAKNSDFILEYQLDKNISLLNQNFSPIVKDNQIIYNTSLSTDKIFLIELNKE